MKIKEKTHRYIEWISPEDMHTETVQWISELKFVRDEQLFLNSLVKHYTSQLADSKYYEESKEIVGLILDEENEAQVLIKKIKAHENQLEIMVDDIDQPRMEQASSAWIQPAEVSGCPASLTSATRFRARTASM